MSLIEKRTLGCMRSFHVPVPFRPDSKTLNISGVLRWGCNMVIPGSGLVFPVSVPKVLLWFDRTGTKCYLEGARPTCEPQTGNTHTHTVYRQTYYRNVPMHVHMLHTDTDDTWDSTATPYLNPHAATMQKHAAHSRYHTGCTRGEHSNSTMTYAQIHTPQNRFTFSVLSVVPLHFQYLCRVAGGIKRNLRETHFLPHVFNSAVC